MDLDEAVTYRIAFGLASDLLEAKKDRYPGRYVANPAAGGDLETIITEVIHRLAIVDQVGAEVARYACEDACDGRRPRW